MTTEDTIRSLAGETLIGKESFSITIPIDQPKRSFIDWLKRKPIIKDRTFTINACKVGNMFRIASKALTLPDQLSKGDWSQVLLPLFQEHLTTIVYIVASAIQNNKDEPAKELISFINDNFDHEDLYTCMAHSLDNVGMDSFLSSIVLVRGTVPVLKPKKTSPLDGSELIASHIQELDQS